MLTDFQNSLTARLTSKLLAKMKLNIPPHHNVIATLPCEMLALKNRNVPELSEANFQDSGIQNSCSNIHPK